MGVISRLTRNEAAQISVEDARNYLLFTGTTDFDDKIRVALMAATAFAEEASGYVMAPDRFSYDLGAWDYYATYRVRGCGPWGIDIPLAPVRAVVSVSYFDSDDVEHVIDPANYLFERNSNRGGRVFARDSYSLPSLSAARDRPLSIVFDAGFDIPGDSGAGDDPVLSFPPQAKAAVFLLTERFYNAGSMDARAIEDIENAATMLLQQIRIIRG